MSSSLPLRPWSWGLQPLRAVALWQNYWTLFLDFSRTLLGTLHWKKMNPLCNTFLKLKQVRLGWNSIFQTRSLICTREMEVYDVLRNYRNYPKVSHCCQDQPVYWNEAFSSGLKRRAEWNFPHPRSSKGGAILLRANNLYSTLEDKAPLAFLYGLPRSGPYKMLKIDGQRSGCAFSLPMFLRLDLSFCSYIDCQL